VEPISGDGTEIEDGLTIPLTDGSADVGVGEHVEDERFGAGEIADVEVGFGAEFADDDHFAKGEDRVDRCSAMAGELER